MTDQLETDLRAALHAQAAQVPATSVARLTHRDYNPRTRGLRPPVAIGAVGATALAAAGAVLLLSLGAGASNAFAGWTPTPSPPSPGQLASAANSCRSHSPVAGLPLKLTDTRGPFTFQIYANLTQSAECISGPSFTAVTASTSSRPMVLPPGTLTADHAVSHLTYRNGQIFSFADGHTGSGVTGATLILDDGTKVQASVSNGWFVAWWPGGHNVKTADVTTPTGVRTQDFDVNHQSPCGLTPCAGASSGSVSGSGSISGPVTNGSRAVESGSRSG